MSFMNFFPLFFLFFPLDTVQNRRQHCQKESFQTLNAYYTQSEAYFKCFSGTGIRNFSIFRHAVLWLWVIDVDSANVTCANKRTIDRIDIHFELIHANAAGAQLWTEIILNGNLQHWKNEHNFLWCIFAPFIKFDLHRNTIVKSIEGICILMQNL